MSKFKGVEESSSLAEVPVAKHEEQQGWRSQAEQLLPPALARTRCHSLFSHADKCLPPLPAFAELPEMPMGTLPLLSAHFLAQGARRPLQC